VCDIADGWALSGGVVAGQGIHVVADVMLFEKK
jgi:hypothetical protein